MASTNFVPPTWIPDENRDRCALCKIQFSMFSRRHHCRLCGDIYCASCSNFTAIVPFLHNDHRPVRHCSVCHNLCVLNQPDRRLHFLDDQTQKHVRKAAEAFLLFEQVEGIAIVQRPNSSTNEPTAIVASAATSYHVKHKLPSYHPDILTTVIDLWWMQQRTRCREPCKWGCMSVLNDVPLAASIEMEISIQRPVKTKGICRIDVEQLASSSELQRFPVSRVRRSTQNRELLGHILLLAVDKGQHRRHREKKSGGDGHGRDGNDDKLSMSDDHHNTSAAAGGAHSSSCRDELRWLVYDFALFSTFLTVVFALVPHYIFGNQSLLDVNVHVFFQKVERHWFQAWLPTPPLVSRSRTASDVIIVVLLISALALRGVVTCFRWCLANKHRRTSRRTSDPRQPMSWKAPTTATTATAAPATPPSTTTLRTLSFIPVGFERFSAQITREHGALKEKDHYAAYSDSELTMSTPPMPLRQSIDEAVRSFVRDCGSESGWLYRGRMHGVERYVGTRSAYPSAKGVGIINASLKNVFDVLTLRQGHNDPIGSFGKKQVGVIDRNGERNINCELEMTNRLILKKYDAHTRIEQVEYNMTKGTQGGDYIKDQHAFPGVRPRQFVSVHHWRVISETEKTVVILSFGTTLMESVASSMPISSLSSSKNTGSDDDDDDDGAGNDRSARYVRGECYGGWMLHPTNQGKSTVVTRLSVVDMRMFTPELEERITTGVPCEIEVLRDIVCSRSLKTKISADMAGNGGLFVHNVRTSPKRTSSPSQLPSESPSESQSRMQSTIETDIDTSHLVTSDLTLASAATTLCVDFLSTCVSNNNWDFYLEENNVKLYRRPKQGKYAEAKGIGVLNYPPSACLSMVNRCSIQNTKASPNPLASKLDSDKLEQRIVADLSGNGHLTLEYMRFRGVPLVVTPRDFVNLTHWRTLPDGALLRCGTTASADLQARFCPPTHGHVRADACLGGWLFEPLEQGRKTKATLIVCLDLKGSLPSWLIAQVTKTQPLCITKLGELLDEDVIKSGCRSRDEYIQRSLENPTQNISPSTPSTPSTLSTPSTPFTPFISSTLGNELKERKAANDVQNPEVKEQCAVNNRIDKMLVKAVDLSTNSSPQWALMFEQDGLVAETLEDGGNLITVRGVLDFPYPPYAIIKLINACNDMHDPRSYRKSPSMKKTKLLKEYDERTAIRYLEMKGLGFVSGRDFCNIHHWRSVDGGAIHAVAFVEERLDLCPVVSGLVRAELIIAGYVLTPIKNEETKNMTTRVTYVVKTDIKGSIPQWIVKIKSKEQPAQLLTLRKMLDEESERHPGGKYGFIEENMSIPKS